MPEYLAPGVFIEEVPPRLRAIEGVSTSTAGFVGYARRGPVAGASPPFTMAGIDTPRDSAPTLVTSFSDFVRTFGEPVPVPDPHGFLGHAVRGFFENGGKRAYISRVLRPNAARAQIATGTGVVLRLARPAAAGTSVFLTSVRGVTPGGSSQITFKLRATGANIETRQVNAVNVATGEITLSAALSNPLDPAEVFATLQNVTVGTTGPVFFARSPGLWGNSLTVLVTPADRGPVTVESGSGSQIVVRSVASFYRGASVEVAHASGAKSTHEVTDIQGNTLTLGSAVSASPATARVLEIDITIADEAGPTPVTETFRALAWNRANVPGLRDRHYSTVINSRSRLVYVEPPATETAALVHQPTTANGFPLRVTTAGGDGSGNPNYVGSAVAPRSGLHALAEIEDIRIVAIPGRTDVHADIITHCESMRYRFAVLDPVEDDLDVNELLAARSLFDTSHAALYAPWLEVAETDRRYLVPPSGHVAGIMARTDNERGVHKAPANEVVRGAIGLAANFTTGEQEILNPRGINAIRRLEGRGIRVWGARTLSSDPALKYVNVRRYLIFLEASLDRGTQWVVFEPNTPETWTRVTDSISSFLNTQWREGALFGRRAEDAYFVRCDETTMTADDIQNGRLICHIGVAIVRPAEFVIFRIEQLTGFAKNN
jgi:uncharacterized protein